MTTSLAERFDNTTSRTHRTLGRSDAVRARRETIACKSGESYRPRWSTRSRGALLRRGVGWTAAKESNLYKERYQKSAMGWGVFIVIIQFVQFISYLLLLLLLLLLSFILINFSLSFFILFYGTTMSTALGAAIYLSIYICSDISHNTSEVLLEVFDHVNKSQRFLGLGIVGVEELLVNPSQRQIIPLQARPYEEDDITGTLTVEVIVL